MLDVLTIDEATLVAFLRAGFFRRVGVRVTAVATIADLEERAAALRPALVLLVARDAGWREACAAASRLRRGQDAPRVLVVTSGTAIGRDGLLPLEGAPGAIAAAVAELTRAPRRLARRRACAIPARIDTAAGDHLGTARDISDLGVGLTLDRAPAADLTGPSVVWLERGSDRRVALAGEGVWRAGARAGLRFLAPGRDALASLLDLALWDVACEDGIPVVRLHGPLTRRTSLEGVRARVAAGSVGALDLEDVTDVTSGGALRWREFEAALSPGARLVLRRVSRAVTRAIDPAAIGGGRVVLESVYVPYACSECGIEVAELVTAADLLLIRLCPLCEADLAPLRAPPAR